MAMRSTYRCGTVREPVLRRATCRICATVSCRHSERAGWRPQAVTELEVDRPLS